MDRIERIMAAAASCPEHPNAQEMWEYVACEAWESVMIEVDEVLPTDLATIVADYAQSLPYEYQDRKTRVPMEIPTLYN